ncbi:Alpha/beta-hydrolase [Mycena venus]|uniref:Carboxypeptidase n=1 Tax=Mycena venus TaxID=2733690 RepID=A0A8H6X5N5_9AGAR|nr:Alpha/beta-hydrolase [Mycena venus]
MLQIALVLGFVFTSVAQQSSGPPPSTFPHAYPGMPKTPFGPDWQQYFEVTAPLPNVTGPIARSFAGNVGVNRADHPNATLFFWAFEKANGTLTGSAKDTDPWMIWLNGGPGSSSMIGMMTENGPLQVTGTFSIVQNNFSWNKLADTFWIDQPVGTGYSTSDATGYVPDEDQMGRDFVEFLSNIVKIFPSLAKRPLYLSGESYAGTYIVGYDPLPLLYGSLTRLQQPYITKTIFSTPNPPVNLRKMIVGDGTLGSGTTFEMVPTITTIETYPQLIGYDPDVYNYFKTQEHLCGYDLNLTYPQNGHFPTLTDPFFGSSIFGPPGGRRARGDLSFKALAKHNGRLSGSQASSDFRKRQLAGREEWKRSLSNRPNGTLDPWYGCLIYNELLDYAVNFTFPWTFGGPNSIDVYDIPDALNPEVPSDPTVFMNDNRTRAALHAPTSKDWLESFDFPFGGAANGTEFGDPSPEPMVFLSELATNASAKGVGIVFYSGNDDSLVAHRGTEVVIQNMTFGGVQGFTRKPATPFTDDHGNFAGIIHQERNLTYALFHGAGHLVPNSVPEAAFVFIREFVLGSNQTGLVDNNSSSVVGGEDSALAGDYMPGGLAIFYGDGDSATTSLSTIAPSATIASWSQFIATATALNGTSGTGTTGNGTTGKKNGGATLTSSLWHVCAAVVVGMMSI